MSRKNYYLLRVTSNMDLAAVASAIAQRPAGGSYITVDNIEVYIPKHVKRGRPQGAGVNVHTTDNPKVVVTDRKAASAAAHAALRARAERAVDSLVGILKERPNLNMEGLCAAMAACGATNRYNNPWTPKNLWPYYEKAYARLEGQIKLSYVGKPDGASTDELGQTD